MLTQFQTTEPQAAFLAACPRPRVQARALASVALRAVPSPVSAPVAAASWRGLGIGGLQFGSAAEVRPFAAERPAGGYALRGVEKAGFAASATMRGATAAVDAEAVLVNVKQQQDQYSHLIRRESRPWRPPH